jgi:hypothetical protein
MVGQSDSKVIDQTEVAPKTAAPTTPATTAPATPTEEKK